MKGFIYIISITILFASCSDNSKKDGDNAILEIGDSLSCSAEDTVVQRKGEAPVFVHDGYKFAYGNQVTEEVAFSGKRSIKLDPSHRFGMEVTLSGVKPNDVYKLSVMRKGTAGNFAMKCPTSNKLYYQFGGEKEGAPVDGWQQIQLYVKVPPHIKGDKIQCYLQYFEKGVTYFDDFIIKRVNNIEYPKFKAEEAINVYLEEPAFNQLQAYREVSFIRNVIPREVKKYVKGVVTYKGDTNKCKLRLKGEWLDHLEGDKWSFRVKVGGSGINELNKFSIHTPLARNYLKEYVAHKLFEDENLLASKYEFLPVTLNDRSLGLYAIEEYFDQKFIKRNNRKGVVLRWDEEGFWNAQKMLGKNIKNSFAHPMFQSSFVTTFSFDKIAKDEKKLEWFKTGSKLLTDFRDDKIKLEDAFCVDQLAKYIALIDICGSFHGATWHNIRYFYNADSSKIEPILFDGYSAGDYDSFLWIERNYIGNLSSDNFSGSYNDYQKTKLFNSKVFRDKYLMYVKKYSSEEFIDKFLNKYHSEITKYEQQIKKEFTFYEFDWDLLKKRSKRLLNVLSKQKDIYSSFNLPIKKYRKINCDYPIVQPYSVQVFTQDNNGLQKQLKLHMNYCKPIEVYVNKQWLELSPGADDQLIIVGAKEENFQMRIVGTSKIYNLEVLPFPKP